MRLDETTSLATLNPLSESWQEAIIADLEGYMRTISTEVVMIICERLKKIGEMNPSSAKQISVLAKDYGVDMERIKKAIAKQLSLSASEVDDIFDRAAKDSCDLADALAMHRLNVVDRRMVELTARAAAKRFKEGLLNLPDTFAFKMGNQMLPLRQAYIQATNKATLAAYSGALDYNTAIRGIVKQLSNQGIQTVEWESGYHRRLDSSVRMNVLEGVRQLNQGVLDEAGEKFATGYEISAHDRPAPDHEDIQGKQYTLQEYEKLNASLERPIGTLNCMHIAYPIIYGVTPPTYTEAQLQQMKDNAHEKYEWQGKELTGYECTQKQRQYETEIRKSQDRERAMRAAGDTVGADAAKHETAALRKEYKAFSEKVGLKEKLNRTGDGRGAVNSQKTKLLEYNDKRISPEMYANVQNRIYSIEGKTTDKVFKNVSDEKNTPDTNKKTVIVESDPMIDKNWDFVKDVRQEYYDKATPGIGDNKKEEGFNDKCNDLKQKEDTAQWIHDFFGGDVVLRADRNAQNVDNPDLDWNGLMWELKSPISYNGISKRLAHGIEQISEKPGGVIINLFDQDFDKLKVLKCINGRMKASRFGYDIDVMVIQKNELMYLLRYRKNK